MITMAHRSLINAAMYISETEDPQIRERLLKIDIMQADARDYGPGLYSTVYFLAKDSTERDRWLEALNPVREDPDTYLDHDCPEYVALKDWIPPAGETDSMPLREGDVVFVQKKGQEFMKGFVRGGGLSLTTLILPISTDPVTSSLRS
eukprot:m.129541 g.129541  ORF g.129541 m.129541 type:complete len:148 (+) comp13679_c0_seq2:166-609(+)